MVTESVHLTHFSNIYNTKDILTYGDKDTSDSSDYTNGLNFYNINTYI